MNEILKCDYSNEATEQYFLMVLFIMLYEVILTFESVDEILKRGHSSESLLSSTFQAFVLLNIQYKVVQSFESLDEIVKYGVSMKASERYFPIVKFGHFYIFKGSVLHE